MKDPLQAEPSPYELLPSLSRHSTRADVERAFRLALVKRAANVQALTRAKQALQRPAERALVEALLYDPDALSDLIPSPLQDSSVLDLPHRAATAAAWEGALRKSFPDGRIAHSLALLWYWWAVHEESRLAALLKAAGGWVEGAGDGRKYALLTRARKAEGAECDPRNRRECPYGDCQWRSDCLSPAPPVERMWESAIAYWAMVISSEEFGDLVGGSAEVSAGLRKSLENRLRNHLHELAQRYRHDGSPALAARYHKLELALSTELRIAREMVAAGIRTVHRKKVACGVLMLQRLALLDTMMGQLDEALRHRPSERLESLRRALLGYALIEELIERKQYQAALDEIEALPADRKKSREAAALRAKALFELGKQHGSAGKNQEAMDCWARALDAAGKNDLQRQIKAEVRSFCQSRAAAIRNHRREEAVALLEKGVKLVSDERLRLTLAELLCQQGIDVFVKAQEEARKPRRDDRAVIGGMEKGLALLERGAKLGSKRAKEQAEVARRILAEERSGAVELAGEDREQLQKANQAAGKEDWDTAISILRRVLATASGQARESLRKKLATCLCNRGVGLINRAIASINAARAAWDRQAESVLGRLQGGGGGDCALCHSSRWLASSWYTVNLPNGNRATVCGQCAGLLQQLLSSRPNPDANDKSMVQGGHADIVEAEELDPTNDHVKECRKTANKVLSDMGLGPLGWLEKRTRRRK